MFRNPFYIGKRRCYISASLGHAREMQRLSKKNIVHVDAQFEKCQCRSDEVKIAGCGLHQSMQTADTLDALVSHHLWPGDA